MAANGWHGAARLAGGLVALGAAWQALAQGEVSRVHLHVIDHLGRHQPARRLVSFKNTAGREFRERFRGMDAEALPQGSYYFLLDGDRGLPQEMLVAGAFTWQVVDAGKRTEVDRGTPEELAGRLSPVPAAPGTTWVRLVSLYDQAYDRTAGVFPDGRFYFYDVPEGHLLAIVYGRSGAVKMVRLTKDLLQRRAVLRIGR